MTAATTVAIEWAPVVPLPLLLALVALSVGVMGLAAWRGARGWSLRALTALALLGVLANPSLVQEQRRMLPDIALIAVDVSASQDLGGRADQRAAAVADLKKRLKKTPNTRVRVVRAGAHDGPPVGGTKLMDDVRRALRGIPRSRLGSVFLVSDGRVHDAPASGDALGIDAPVHLIQTGDPAAGDRRLLVKDAPRYGIVDDSVTVTVRVDDLGVSDPPASAQLTFRRDDGAAQTVTVPVGEPATVDIPVHRRGRIVIALRAAEGPAEITTRNNRAALTINGVRDRLKVLLVSGMPHAGERAWRRLLKSDPSVSLVHFTILRPPSKQRATPIEELSLIAFPTRKLFQEKIDGFDLIIFDRYTWRGVLPRLYLNNVARYVRQGGALLVASGPSFAGEGSLYRTPLRTVLPARPRVGPADGPFVPAVSDTGRRHPVTASLPGAAANRAGTKTNGAAWGRWFRHIPASTKRGHTLLRAKGGAPLLVLDSRGEGRVAQLLSDQIWLWARGYDGGGPQQALMRRTAHWLMKEPTLAAEALRARVRNDQLTITRRSLSALDSTTAEVTPPDGAARTVQLGRTRPGRHTARAAVEHVGLYEVTHGERAAFAAVGAPSPLEYRNVRPTAEVVQPLMDATGGGSIVYADTGTPRVRKVDPDGVKHGAGWLGVVANGAHRVTGATTVPLLPAALALILLGALMVSAWYREGR